MVYIPTPSTQLFTEKMDEEVDGYSVVQNIHMISEGGQILTAPDGTAQVLSAQAGGKNVGPSEATEGGNAAQIITDGSTRIITAADGSQIITNEAGQIIAADTSQIFTDENGDIILDDSGQIAANGRLLHTGGHVVTENGETHIISAEGHVISVSNDVLEGGREPDQSVTEVVEETAVSIDPMVPRIKREPTEDELEATAIQIRVNASSPRKKDTPVVEQLHEEEEAPKSDDSVITIAGQPSKYTKVDRDDPRSRLHFVKYMKRDGKTIKIWECGICGKEFMHQYTLMRHLPTHTDERNFKCNICGKAFRQMSTLSQHKATHSTSRPYVCDICQKTFSRVSTLISHKKTHTEEKPHRCHICGKAFHQKGNLKNHLYTHTNERPYKCDLCGRGFNQASNLQCHKAKAHSEGVLSYQYEANKYKCTVCDSSFPRKAQMRQHQEYKHGIRNIYSGAKSAVPSTDFGGVGGSPAVGGLLKKRKIGNVRIIQLPNGDRTFQEIPADEEVTTVQKKSQRLKGQGPAGILIEPIDTKAMHRALSEGRTPFALLKPIKGVPVVVKVRFARGNKHMLVPANADDLRDAGKFSISSKQSGAKSVQIKVPVVATVIQRVDKAGQLHMDIEPPNEGSQDEEDIEEDEEDHEDKIPANVEILEHKMEENEQEAMLPDQHHPDGKPIVFPHTVVQSSMARQRLEEEEEESSIGGSILPGEESISIGEGAETVEYSMSNEANIPTSSAEAIQSVDLLATAVNLVSQAQTQDVDHADGVEGLEGVQYLRQMSLGEYEVVPAEDSQATHIMNQHGHIQQIKLVDEGGGMTMDQANISALMDALQNAGYQLSGGSQHVIINSEGNAVVVDDQQVQMVIDGNMEGVVTTEGVVATEDGVVTSAGVVSVERVVAEENVDNPEAGFVEERIVSTEDGMVNRDDTTTMSYVVEELPQHKVKEVAAHVQGDNHSNSSS